MNKHSVLDFLNFYRPASANVKLSNTVSCYNNNTKKMV